MRIATAVGVTDTGRRRHRNEDAFVCAAPLFAVADGMGGAQAGEVASRLATAALGERVTALRGATELVEIIRTANARIFAHAAQDPSAAGMGTTVTVALVDEGAGTATIAHVGDSRAYRLAPGRLERLTSDHSLVAELVRAGRLTETEAAVHPHRSVITRVLGTEAVVEIDTTTVRLAPGDVLLLCSDGLTAMVRDERILALAEETAFAPQALADALIATANEAGGDDNITVVIASIEEGEPPVREHHTPPGQGEVAVPAPLDAVGGRRHGIGAGGRLPALLAIGGAVVLALLALAWGIVR
ncbi:MAG: Stp1/IreP family PP2C-type Ser/Thr phosphatase [Thermoleophilia bacterium]|nr:Stp1/IreP family PP2C-type Ser/Thr phosphatase [Thermoleophilia bacterium]